MKALREKRKFRCAQIRICTQYPLTSRKCPLSWDTFTVTFPSDSADSSDVLFTPEPISIINKVMKVKEP